MYVLRLPCRVQQESPPIVVRAPVYVTGLLRSAIYPAASWSPVRLRQRRIALRRCPDRQDRPSEGMVDDTGRRGVPGGDRGGDADVAAYRAYRGGSQQIPQPQQEERGG